VLRLLFNYAYLLIKVWQSILAKPEFRAVVVMGTRIKIYQHCPRFNSNEELLEVKFLKNKNIFIEEELHIFLTLHFSLNIETVEQLGPRLMVDIIETPIGLGI